MNIYVKPSSFRDCYKDGGTIRYQGWDGNAYYEDHRIDTKTKGQIYAKAYPGNEGCILLLGVKIVECNVPPDEV